MVQKKNEILISSDESVTTRFMYTWNTFWKYLKIYMAHQLGTVAEQDSPKPVARTAAKIKLISEEESASCIEMIDIYNLMVHIYRQEVASTIVRAAQRYYATMHNIVDRITPTTAA